MHAEACRTLGLPPTAKDASKRDTEILKKCSEMLANPGLVASATSVLATEDTTDQPSHESAKGRGEQARKSVWWMPWHREATKDVRACDKLRGAGN